MEKMFKQTTTKRAMLVLAMCLTFSINSMGQKLRYEFTKMYSEYRGGWEECDKSITYFEFSGNTVILDLGYPAKPLTWRFHHSEGGNNVYYLIAHDYIFNKDIFNERSMLIVSPDKQTINQKSLDGPQQYVTIYVYKLKPEGENKLYR